MLRLRALVIVCSAGLVGARAHAQTRAPDVTRELQLFESTERDLDPLGLDESTGTQLDEAAQKLEEARRRAKAPRPPTAVVGDVLTSIEGVSEVAHLVQIRLAEGLAFVRVELRFESRSTYDAEIAYRLPLPRDAALFALRVCRAQPGNGGSAASQRCENGVATALGAEQRSAPPAQDGADLVASATPIHDARGPALSLQLGALRKNAPLSLQLDYVAPAEAHGGVVRFRLPARGYDPRIAPSELRSEAPGLTKLTPAVAVQRDAHLPLDVRAELETRPARLRTRTRAMCGGQRCARDFEAAPAGPLVTRETWLLLDASPSMEGPARNAADAALTGLLSVLPEQTQLRVFAFAARARELGRFAADAAPLALLSDALLSDLGATSRPGAALALGKSELATARPRVLMFSDGKLDSAALRELAGARKRGAELWLIALAAGAGRLAQHFDGSVDASASTDPGELEERLRAALSSQVDGGLRRGEQRVRENAPLAPYLPRRDESWLSFWYARKTPSALRTSARAASAGSVAPAFVSTAPPPAAADTGMPKESVLSMLRTQLVPQARACLRADRKGRGDYAVGLTFHALFAEREAYDVRVEGKIPDALRSCLTELVPALRIPAFSGRIRVRYPIHTEREPEPPVVELVPELLEQLNRVIDAK